jgi:hypothetical protein
MHCFANTHQQAILTSVTIVSVFYILDLTFLKYLPRLFPSDPRLARLTEVLQETAAAKKTCHAKIHLENPEATIREIVDSHRDRPLHADSNLLFYQ